MDNADLIERIENALQHAMSVRDLHNRGFSCTARLRELIPDLLAALIEANIKLDEAIERHEADMQRVSGIAFRACDTMVAANLPPATRTELVTLIIKPPVDPLVEVLRDMGLVYYNPARDWHTEFRAALSRHGLSIVKGEG